jgi:hypothetical protein
MNLVILIFSRFFDLWFINNLFEKVLPLLSLAEELFYSSSELTHHNAFDK